MLSNNLNHFDRAFHSAEVEENRKGGRFPTMSVRSSLGEVLDLSSGGALILKRRFRKVPSDKVFGLEIRYEEIKAVVNARVVRSTKKPGIGQLFAIEFIDPTDEQREAIKDIVRNSRNWRLFDLNEDTEAA